MIHWCIYLLWYPLHQYLPMGKQETLNHYHMTHRQKTYSLKEIPQHATDNPIWYRTYQLTWIQIQFSHILLCQINLSNQTMSIINQ